ncbi:MAG: ECF transporter S component [Propionibacteriaceae bacterium]|jgi:energy-coupling factor transport system substrate-specific component|nr:ECF transporter S component [Propionibacteriaceae bacterium]
MSHLTESADLTRPATTRWRWRVVDIVVAAVLGVACGLLFWAWNGPGYVWYDVMNAVTPGLGGLAQGLWLIGGPLGGLVIRKPGAAFFVELVAAICSALLGNVWGMQTLIFGVAEALGAELAFALFAYRRFGLPVAMLAGVLAGVGEWASELFTGNLAKSVEFNTIYLISNMVSGAVLAGILAWVLVRLLARTGVLNRFASGRAAG